MESSKTVISLPGAAAPQIPTNNFVEKSSQLASKGDEVKFAKAEMNQVREENTRLKKLLQEIGSEYKSLKMRVSNNTHSEVSQEAEEHELVSLCLGRSQNESKKEEHVDLSKKTRGEQDMDLKLGRGYGNDESKFDSGRSRVDSSPYRSSSETKEEDSGGQTWSPSKGLKGMRSTGDEDDVSQASVKRARVSVRAKCNTPTMNDGCQWRKYGQKIAKNNPCPRAYYRCTVAPSCPVRKQVQRCADDMSILITTYEGTHNHPLPVSATAMASTTSAAASMLLSGSSSSTQGLGTAASANMASSFHGFNVNLSKNSNVPPFYLHNSGSPPFPTVTLDLTATPSTSSSQYNMVSTAFASTPRFPTTYLGFSASNSNVLPAVWGKGNLAYGTAPFCNKTQDIGSFQTGRPFQEHLSQPESQKNYQVPSQQVLTETLTKAITSDPSFRSIIAAAISTVVAGGSPAQAKGQLEIVGRNLTRDDQETSAV